MKTNNPIKLAVVVPCYNEQEVIAETAKRLSVLMKEIISKGVIATDSFVLFVNDGSKDNTWELIKDIHKADSNIFGLNLSRNVGHQNALVAGMDVASDHADAIVTIDADLQDDVKAIVQMIEEFYKGSEIVYGVRSTRKRDSFFKKYTALLFYKLISLLGANTIYNHADYRLMSHRAVKHFLKFQEKNLFIRGIIPLIGYKSSKVFYERNERFAGETKYPFIKMFNFAVDGVTSFSVKPLRIIFGVGFIFLFLTFVAGLYVLVQYFRGDVVTGWTSLILSVWLIGSIVIISLGIIGEYIGKIYTEVKNRPRYNIECFLKHDDNE